MQDRKQQLEQDLKQQADSKWGKVYVKGVCKAVYAEDIMPNAVLEEAQAEFKITGRNINNLRYADDTTIISESKKELKSLLMKVKEESESWLKTQH